MIGIVIVLILCGIFIVVGVMLIENFFWIFYLFGVLLFVFVYC